MRAGPRLLVTGFGPFPGAPENPTATLVESLAREPAERFGAGVFRAEILPTEYRRSWSVMRGLNASFSPDVVVHFGLSGRAEAVTIETVARRRIDPARPDVVGYAPPLGVARGSGPDIVRCDWPANEIAGLLTQAGFPAVISEDAGDYVCNATFYRSLRARHAQRPRGGLRARAAGGPERPDAGEAPGGGHARSEGRVGRLA